jgi:hypothetical protein
MRFEPLLACLVTIGFASPAWADGGPPRVVDGVAAAVGYEVVTRSLLHAYRAAFWPGASDAVALEALVDERLLGAEARRYGLTPDARGLARLVAQQPAPPGFRETEWREVLVDRVLAGQLLAFRFGDYVPIEREAILAYLAAHPQLSGVTPEAREAAARAALLPEARARRETAFKAELRARAEFRMVPQQPSPD